MIRDGMLMYMVNIIVFAVLYLLVDRFPIRSNRYLCRKTSFLLFNQLLDLATAKITYTISSLFSDTVLNQSFSSFQVD